MTTFNNLPLELLPVIVQNVVNPGSLASFCLVNKFFCEFTQPFLYHTIAVFPWNQKEKVAQHDRKSFHQAPECTFLDLLSKTIRLFRTLSSSPELAWHVRKLGDAIYI